MKKHCFLRLIFLAPCLLILFCATQAVALAEPQFKINNEAEKLLRLPIYQWSDSSVPTIGHIVTVPGLVFDGSAYDSMARRLASKGFVVYGMELRGLGRWRNESEKFDGDKHIHYGKTRDDVLSVLQYFRTKEPSLPTYLVGESFGANVGLWVMSTHPDLLDGAILSSPTFKQCLHPRLEAPVDLCKMLWRPHKPINIAHYYLRYLSESPEIRRSCAKDSAIARKLSAADLIKAAITSRDCWKRIDEIGHQMPILVLAGKKDRIADSSVVPKTIKRIGSTEISLHMLKDRGHLILEHQALDDNLAQMIEDWLGERQKKPEPGGRIATVGSIERLPDRQ